MIGKNKPCWQCSTILMLLKKQTSLLTTSKWMSMNDKWMNDKCQPYEQENWSFLNSGLIKTFLSSKGMSKA